MLLASKTPGYRPVVPIQSVPQDTILPHKINKLPVHSKTKSHWAGGDIQGPNLTTLTARCNKSTVTPVVPFRLIPQSGLPIAEQVAHAAKKAIFSGKLRPGDTFPSVRELARAMKIHANTAQKVIAQLAAEGLVEVRPGIGTVVGQAPAPRAGNARLLARDVEQLALRAIQSGVPLAKLQSSLEECWRSLTGEDKQNDSHREPHEKVRRT